MYRIKVINTATGEIFYEYGFSRYIMKEIHYFLNEQDANFYRIYDIINLSKIVFTPKTFYKCLKHHVQIIDNVSAKEED